MKNVFDKARDGSVWRLCPNASMLPDLSTTSILTRLTQVQCLLRCANAVAWLACLLVFAGSGLCQSEPATAGRIERIVIPAPSLEGNALGDATSQRALVYLPPGYDKHTSRYPVLYLLHGFSLGSVLEDWGEVVAGAMDGFTARDPARAYIVVIPNGTNAVSGSFYLNSSVGGNWERFITEDVVRYVDRHYRTLPNRLSRAVAGHSMGGFAALRLAILHSDEFSTVYAMSPCCLDFQDDFTAMNPAWHEILKMETVEDIKKAVMRKNFWATALAAFSIAASPNLDQPLKADLPYRMHGPELVPNADVIERWKSVMPLNMVGSHKKELETLSGLAVDFGYEDDFTHIPDTVEQFGRSLQTLKVPVLVDSYHGDHNNQVPVRVGTRVVPFIADHLSFAK